MARRAPCPLAISTARSTAALSPETTTWPPPLSLAAWHIWPRAASAATATACSKSSPRSAAIAPLPTGTAFCMARPRMRRSRAVSPTLRAPGRGERRIFSKRMAGNELRVASEIDPGLGFQHAHDRKRHRHQRGLRVLGQRQCLGRPFPNDLGELLVEGRVDLLEHRARRRERIGERLAHADRLATLAGKNERERHALALVRTGPKTPRYPCCQAEPDVGVGHCDLRLAF